MESSTVISLEVSSNDRECVTEDNAIRSNIISKPIESISINPSNAAIRGSNADISKQNACSIINQVSVNAPTMHERIDKAELGVVSAFDNPTELSTTAKIHETPLCQSIHIKKKMKKMQPHIMSNKCKIALILIVVLIIIVPVVSLIVWGTKSRDKENIKSEPVTNLTTIGLTECWHKSVNNSEHCNNSIGPELTDIRENITTSENISLLLRQETTTRSVYNITSPGIWELTNIRENISTTENISLLMRQETSPGIQKITASIGFTAWATYVVSYSEGTTLIFNGMDEEHNGFDRSTGIFTCPITGIYYVYVALRKNNLNDISVDVFKMDTRIIHFSHNYTGSPWITVSNSALISCSMGETIQMKGWSSGSIYGDDNVRCSSFSVINVDQIAQKSPNDTFVGYSGYANSQSLSYHGPMNFTNQLCNVGNHFSSYRFKCPHMGIYFVSITYKKYPSKSYIKSVFAGVFRGDTLVLSLYDKRKMYTYGTTNALIRCNKGEYIESRGTTTSYVYGSESYPEYILTVMSVHQEDKSRPFIGFTRFKIGYQIIEDGDVITFPEIRMDEENYFQSNQFVCPVNGYYYFLLNLAKMKNVNIKVNLMLGYRKVFKLEDTQASNFYNTISNSVVIRCMKDDVVKVVAAGIGLVDGGKGFTKFSGFLLYQN